MLSLARRTPIATSPRARAAALSSSNLRVRAGSRAWKLFQSAWNCCFPNFDLFLNALALETVVWGRRRSGGRRRVRRVELRGGVEDLLSLRLEQLLVDLPTRHATHRIASHRSPFYPVSMKKMGRDRTWGRKKPCHAGENGKQHQAGFGPTNSRMPGRSPRAQYSAGNSQIAIRETRCLGSPSSRKNNLLSAIHVPRDQKCVTFST